MAKTVLFPLDRFDEPTGGGISALNIITGLDPARYRALVVFPEQCAIIEELQKQGIDVRIRRLHDFTSGLQYARDIFRAMRFLRRERVALIHFNHLGYWKPAEILAAKLLRIPIITHIRLIQKQPTPFLKYSDCVIANSHFTANHSDLPAGKVEVVYNAVNLSTIDAGRDIREELGLQPEHVVVSFIGSLTRIKGIEFFLAMAERIRAEHVRFLVLGNAGDEDYFRQISEKMQQNPRVHYLGYYREIENIYVSSDIITMPSQCAESFGRVTIEAGAARKPVIVTNAGALSEIVRHGESGYVVERDDLAAFVDFVEQCVGDAALRARLGENGRKRAERYFSLQTHLSAVEAVYTRLCA